MEAMTAVAAKTRMTVELAFKGLQHFHHSDVLERFFLGFRTRQRDDRMGEKMGFRARCLATRGGVSSGGRTYGHAV
jgi:hypothetical protein